MNLANKLTMLRVLMIPVYLVLWNVDALWSGYAALAVFVSPPGCPLLWNTGTPPPARCGCL